MACQHRLPQLQLLPQAVLPLLRVAAPLLLVISGSGRVCRRAAAASAAASGSRFEAGDSPAYKLLFHLPQLCQFSLIAVDRGSAVCRHISTSLASISSRQLPQVLLLLLLLLLAWSLCSCAWLQPCTQAIAGLRLLLWRRRRRLLLLFQLPRRQTSLPTTRRQVAS